METDQLKIVTLVARHGSFASAARVLGVDPSSVSRTVAAVEGRLGLRLFQRTTRALTLTEEGEVYLRRIEPVLDELEQAQEEARQSRRAPSGLLRMTTSVAFAHECVVPHLPQFLETYPDVSVELSPSDANLDIAAQGIDLAVRLSATPQGDLISTRLVDTRYRVVASPGYISRFGAITQPGDLETRTCLRFALPGYRTRWLFRRDGVTETVTVDGRLTIGSALALRQAARDGLGPALLADWMIQRDLDAGHLVDLLPDHDCTATEFSTGAWALYPSRQYLPLKVRAMIDHLRSTLRKP